MYQFAIKIHEVNFCSRLWERLMPPCLICHAPNNSIEQKRKRNWSEFGSTSPSCMSPSYIHASWASHWMWPVGSDEAISSEQTHLFQRTSASVGRSVMWFSENNISMDWRRRNPPSHQPALLTPFLFRRFRPFFSSTWAQVTRRLIFWQSQWCGLPLHVLHPVAAKTIHLKSSTCVNRAALYPDHHEAFWELVDDTSVFFSKTVLSFYD
jgi:hypothetical protein